jgi:alcohol dehydrogenase class IV
LSLSRHIEPGVTDKDFTDIVVKAHKASSMKGNSIELTQEELREILVKAI